MLQVFAHDRQDVESIRAVARDERLLAQALERVEISTLGPRDGDDVLRTEPAAEDAGRDPDRSLVLQEPLPRGLQGRAHGALAVRQVARPPAREIELAIEPALDGGEAEERGAVRRQLDRERNAVELVDDPLDPGDVLWRQVAPIVPVLQAIDEELDGGGALRDPGGQLQRPELQDRLRAEAKHLA